MKSTMEKETECQTLLETESLQYNLILHFTVARNTIYGEILQRMFIYLFTLSLLLKKLQTKPCTSIKFLVKMLINVNYLQ